MEQVILPLFISFALYAALFVLIQQKKKQQNDTSVKGKPLPFINQFFIYSIWPTLIMVFFMDFEFYQFVVFYGYSLVMVYLANIAYKKTVERSEEAVDDAE